MPPRDALIVLLYFGKFDIVLTGSLPERDAEFLVLRAWPDADLNGDVMSTRSTSGFFEELAGLEGRGIQLAWGTKRQEIGRAHV